MQYGTPFTFLFRQPHLTMTLLVGSVLFFIPIVGPIVLMGWCVVVHRALLTGSEEVPPLQFDDFSRYLNLGIGPFVVRLIVGLVLSFVLVPLMMVPGMALGILAPVMAQQGTDETTVLAFAIGGLIVSLFLTLFIVILMAMVVQVVVIRAELTPEVNQAMGALSWSYVKGFWKLVKKELILSAFVYSFVSSLFVVLGMFFFYFGAFPAAVITQAAGVHLRSQLYTIYLSRGGAPLPIRPLEGVDAQAGQQGVPMSYGGSAPR